MLWKDSVCECCNSCQMSGNSGEDLVLMTVVRTERVGSLFCIWLKKQKQVFYYLKVKSNI